MGRVPFRLAIKNSFWIVAADRNKSQDQCELSEPTVHSIPGLSQIMDGDSHIGTCARKVCAMATVKLLKETSLYTESQFHKSL